MKRIPRPLGLTLQLRQTNDIKKVKEQIIDTWIQNQYRYNGEVYSIERMATHLSLPMIYITKRSIEQMKKLSGVLNHMKIEEIARVIFSGSFFKAIEIQALSEQQYRLLERSQGGKYRAFVSSEVNKSLANLISTQKPLLDLLKVLTDKMGPINPQGPNDDNPQAIQAIGTEEALRILTDKEGTMLTDKSLISSAISQYQSLPDVGARTQDLRGIGIKYDGTPPVIPSIPNPQIQEPIQQEELDGPKEPIRKHRKVDHTDYELMDEEEFVS